MESLSSKKQEKEMTKVMGDEEHDQEALVEPEKKAEIITKDLVKKEHTTDQTETEDQKDKR